MYTQKYFLGFRRAQKQKKRKEMKESAGGPRTTTAVANQIVRVLVLAAVTNTRMCQHSHEEEARQTCIGAAPPRYDTAERPVSPFWGIASRSKLPPNHA